MKPGDLVQYVCPMTGGCKAGLITDTFDLSDGSEIDRMYEVICTDPFDRGWFRKGDLQVLSEKK